jgi:integrase/recombinase XerD
MILDHLTTFHNYAFHSTVYACGLRISEAIALQVSDIDGKRMMIHVHRGKGAKNRYVPLPQDTYQYGLGNYFALHLYT